jgi:hypothetical protein
VLDFDRGGRSRPRNLFAISVDFDRSDAGEADASATEIVNADELRREGSRDGRHVSRHRRFD